MQDNSFIRAVAPSALAANDVLRKTYLLLSATLIFSAGTAWYAMATHARMMNPLIMLVAYFGLLMLTNALRERRSGVVAVFALTGFLGYTLGPIVSLYLRTLPNGAAVVSYALGTTGLVFVGLSTYAVVSRRDFSFMGSFLLAGMIVAFVASIATLFLHLPALMLATSSIFVLVMSGWILYQTSAIIHGGETNYITATVNLYVALYNIFLSLLEIMGFMSRRN